MCRPKGRRHATCAASERCASKSLKAPCDHKGNNRAITIPVGSKQGHLRRVIPLDSVRCGTHSPALRDRWFKSGPRNQRGAQFRNGSWAPFLLWSESLVNPISCMSFGVPVRRRVAHTLPLDVCAVDHTAAGNWGVRCGFPTVADMKSDVGGTRESDRPRCRTSNGCQPCVRGARWQVARAMPVRAEMADKARVGKFRLPCAAAR